MTRQNTDIRGRFGGSLILVVAIGLGIMLTVFAAVYIYNQMFTHQREAQTAVDAAALAVSQEISKVTTQDPNLGWIGVCDGYQTGGLQQQPVYGINTLVGRARLDAVISRQLANNDMTLLANRDALQTIVAANSLKTILTAANATGTLTYNRPGAGNTPVTVNVNLADIAAQAYNANLIRTANDQSHVANGQQIQPADVQIELGYVQGDSNGLTDIPIPSPNNMSGGADAANFSSSLAGVRYYKAGVNVPVPGLGNQYVFSCVTSQPHLVDRIAFTNTAPAPMMAPTVVRVRINQPVKLNNPKGGELAGNKVEVACAHAGGQRVPVTAGILRFEAPQGLPEDQTSGNHFVSIRSIMDAGAAAWSGEGRFFTANGGAFPGSGTITPASYPPSIPSAASVPAGSPAVNGTTSANPSQLMAYYVYDWLRNDCLRPNVQAVVNALSFNLRTAAVGSVQVASTGFTRKDVQIADASRPLFGNLDLAELLMPKAIAQANIPECNNIWGGLFELIPNSTQAMSPGQDPRSLMNFNEEPDAYVDQAYVFRMQASTPQQLAFAGRNVMATGLDLNTGCPTTAGGSASNPPQPVYILLDLREDIANAQNNALSNYDVARLVFDATTITLNNYEDQLSALTAELSAITAQMAALPPGDTAGYNALTVQYNAKLAQFNSVKALFDEEQRKYTRASNVMYNAINIINSANAIVDNMLAISSLGVNRTMPASVLSTARPRSYSLAGGAIIFAPTETIVTQAQIEGTVSTIATGQVSAAPGTKNWLSTVSVVAGNPGGVTSPTCVMSTIPSSQTRNYEFVTLGDAAGGQDQANNGILEVTTSNSVPTNDGLGHTYDSSNSSSGGGGNGSYVAQANNFDNITGVSALLEGESQYQALNVYRPGNTCDRDPANPRFRVDWSIMAQNNVTNFSDPTVDVRNEETPGNKLDCVNTPVVPNPNERACRHEAVRIQITSPLLEVPPLVMVTPPPPPVPAPPVPSVPPPSPPPPPRRSH